MRFRFRMQKVCYATLELADRMRHTFMICLLTRRFRLRNGNLMKWAYRFENNWTRGLVLCFRELRLTCNLSLSFLC